MLEAVHKVVSNMDELRQLGVREMKYKNLAIITARGGSKRIPRKNIKDFCGKPIDRKSVV